MSRIGSFAFLPLVAAVALAFPAAVADAQSIGSREAPGARSSDEASPAGESQPSQGIRRPTAEAVPLLAPVPAATLELRNWAEAIDLLRRRSTDDRIALAGVERAQGVWRQALSALLPNARFNAQVTLDVLNPSRPSLDRKSVV